MKAISALANLHRSFATHPLTCDAPMSAWARFTMWQLRCRLKDEILFQWIGGQRLAVKRGMTGATGNIYLVLHEFADMMLPLHFLREDDLFLDVGANVGSYTVLASGVCRAKTWAFEPDADTIRHLERNIAVNNLDPLVQTFECALGAERGDAFLRLVQGSADLLFDTAERYGIDCDARRTGWIQPAHSPGRARLAVARAAQWQARGAPVEALDAAGMAEHLGSDVYFGGWRHGGGGHINPLAFTRGLARAVQEEGGIIRENSPVMELQREADGWRLRTSDGAVRCRRVVVLTAAYTGGLWPGLASTIVPVPSYQLATHRLPAVIVKKILPHDEAASDTRFDLRYFRKDRQGRLITGGALAIQIAVHARLQALVGSKLAETFPDIDTPDLPHFWGGRIPMTVDRLPHLHRTADGLVGWIGCNGRGLALCMAMGSVMRDAVLDVADDALPLAPTPFVPVPFQPLVRRVARLALVNFRRKDAREV